MSELDKPFDAAAVNVQYKLARCIGAIEFRQLVSEMGQGAAAKRLIDDLAANGLTIVPDGAVNAEREACAAVADSFVDSPYVEVGKETALSIAKAIRARRNTSGAK